MRGWETPTSDATVAATTPQRKRAALADARLGAVATPTGAKRSRIASNTRTPPKIGTQHRPKQSVATATRAAIGCCASAGANTARSSRSGENPAATHSRRSAPAPQGRPVANGVGAQRDHSPRHAGTISSSRPCGERTRRTSRNSARGRRLNSRTWAINNRSTAPSATGSAVSRQDALRPGPCSGQHRAPRSVSAMPCVSHGNG